jgi:tRNA G18 (ribose-2'-O)-methylase SpoU
MVYFLFVDRYSIESILLLKTKCVSFIFVRFSLKDYFLSFILNASLYKNLKCFFILDDLFFSFFSKKDTCGVVIFLENIYLQEKMKNLLLLYKFFFKKNNFFCVIIHNLQNSYNIGSCIRTASAVGSMALFITGYYTCGLTRYAVRSSCGSVFLLPIFEIKNLTVLVTFLCSYGIRVINICIKGEEVIYFQKFTQRVVFLFCSEGFGLFSLSLSECGNFSSVSIPMFGKLNSLNVSCSVSVVLFELVRQRFFNFL